MRSALALSRNGDSRVSDFLLHDDGWHRMAGMLPKLLSHDLRPRVVRAIDVKLPCREAAARYNVVPSTEDALKLLREIEVHFAGGMDVPLARRQAGISDATYYTWRVRLQAHGTSEVIS